MEMNRKRKGIFVTISVFFLVLALLLVLGVANSALISKKTNLAQSSGIYKAGSMRSNIEWMAKETFSVSGFRYSVYNKTISITENTSMRGSLRHDLDALKEFWNTEPKVSLDIFEEAETPLLYIRPGNLTIRQAPANTTITVHDYSAGSPLAYFISMKTECTNLSSEWRSLSEGSIDPLNVSVSLECTNAHESISDLRQIDRAGHSELLITDSGKNLTIIRILDPGSLEVQKFKGAHLNIILPMNESVYFEIPSSLSIVEGDASYNGSVRISG
jgi:hypothetical protein